MAKPPKTIKAQSSDTSSPPFRRSSEEDVVRGDHPGHSGLHPSEGDPAPNLDVSTNPSQSTPHVQPIVVTEMPTRAPVTRPVNLVSWPREQVDQLIPIGDSGLFMSKDQKMYADIETAGIGRVETNSQGKYQVHFPFAPDHPGPAIKKIEGKPQWQFLERRPAPQASDGDAHIPPADAPVTFVNPVAVEKIPKADILGIRWHNHRSYVDLINEGTLLVGRNSDGVYQATTSQERTPSGPILERIGVTQFWERTSTHSRLPIKRVTDEHASSSDDFEPGPSKRPRTQESADAPAHATLASDSDPYLWASWGTIVKPDSEESIQINQLHYQTVPQGVTRYPLLTYLQHPEFRPSRFEPFEKMLRESPWLQPVAAIRSNTASAWIVQSRSRQFDRPLTQTVMDSYRDFSVHTARAIAKRLFERSGESEVIIQDGLSATAVTLRHWNNQSKLFVPELENPLDLLPVAPRTGPSGKLISTLPPTPDEPLHRLDFTLQRYQVEWTLYLSERSDYHLKRLVNSVLINNGYGVFPFTNEQGNPALIFKRNNHDKVYFLKLGLVVENSIDLKAPFQELSDPGLKIRVGENAYRALIDANAHNNIVWLVGGIQSTDSGWQSIFIMKER